jgi:exodeoxyribonuclease VIII
MKTEKHLMIDIETMDNKSTAAVIAIGARTFTVEGGPGKGFEVFIDPDKAAEYGTISSETMKWWGKQNSQQQAFAGKVHPSTAVFQFSEFVKQQKPEFIWANSPEFDIAIMRYLCDQVGVKWPFHYRDARDCRTMFRLGEALGIDVKNIWSNKDRKPHLPLDDATTQAEVTAYILKKVFNNQVSFSGPGSAPPPYAPPHSAPLPVETA